MKNPFFYIVDVFTEEKYSGNQLAVIRLNTPLPDRLMQRIALEMNYSETTFILSDKTRNNGYDVRIFTPKEELPFAGHPTLGTAYVIEREIIREKTDTIRINLKAGQIPVKITGSEPEIMWMRQTIPEFGEIANPKTLAQMLSLKRSDMDENFPIREVSTGLFCFIVPLKSINALKRARIDREKYFNFIKNTTAKAILIFCPEQYKKENNMAVRFFADYYGISEDAATGSANGCLAGYLIKYAYFGKEKINLRVEQGYEINRPSLILLDAGYKHGEIEINVGGRCIMTAKGELV